jgi:hypothetical protein
MVDSIAVSRVVPGLAILIFRTVPGLAVDTIAVFHIGPGLAIDTIATGHIVPGLAIDGIARQGATRRTTAGWSGKGVRRARAVPARATSLRSLAGSDARRQRAPIRAPGGLDSGPLSVAAACAGTS